MMKKIVSAFYLLAATLLIAGCQKEYSYEVGQNTGSGNGNTNAGTSKGTLGGAPGICSNTVVSGVYAQGTALSDSNYIVAEVTIDTIGTYTIGSDTVNGVYFLQSGTFTTAGPQTVKIKGWGKPLNPGTFTHQLRYKGSNCSFDVTTTAVVVAPTGDYFPTTTGSNWTYIDLSPTATADDTLRATSTGTTASFSGNNYSIFLNDDGGGLIDSSYYRKGGGIYYEYGDLDQIGYTDNGVFGEVIILKDNVTQGNTWESASFPTTVATTPATLKVVSTLLEKNVTKQIGTRSYANVMVVKNSFQIKISIAPFVEVGDAEVWYAKGIGVIRNSAAITSVGSVSFGVQRFQVN